MEDFEIEGKRIAVFPVSLRSPVVYLNTYSYEEGLKVREELEGEVVNLVLISSLEWNHDMTPWSIPSYARGAEVITGGADEYLSLLGEIIEKAEMITGPVSWRGIAGYSLAGLFALYSLFRTDWFSRAASISGSLWFPGFVDYVCTHEMVKKPESIYLSLGDKEKKTRNAVMRSVEENTVRIAEYLNGKGIRTSFVLNPGNHFTDPVERTVKAIRFLMNS